MTPRPIESLEIWILDWPDRFFVEAENYDRDYFEFFPKADPIENPAPHLVDLGELESGWCDCEDFRRNVEPFLKKQPFVNEIHRTECKHIICARRFRDRLGSKPKPLPDKI